jgi:hypothetical protein
MISRDRLFGIIYRNVRNKHPDWSNRRVQATVVHCLLKAYKTK